MNAQVQSEWEEAFDRETKARGGRLDLAVIDPVAHPLLLEHKSGAQWCIDLHRFSRQTAPTGTMPHVHFDYIENYDANACAFSPMADIGAEFIGLYLGCVHLLEEMFNRMLAHPDNFPAVGRPEMEANWFEPWPYLFSNVGKLAEWSNRQPGQQHIIARNPLRRAHARLLSTLALHYLVSHELAHLRNGHVLLARTRFNATSLEEQYGSDDDSEVNLTKQACEMDADSWAVVQGIGFVKRILDTPAMAPAAWLAAEDPFLAAVEDWAAAIYSLFCLFAANLNGGDDDPLRSRTHPPPRVRQVIILDTIYPLLQRDYGKDYADRYVAHVPAITTSAESAIARLTGEEPVFDHAALPMNRRYAEGLTAVEYIEVLEDYWQRMVRPSLLPLSRATDLP